MPKKSKKPSKEENAEWQAYLDELKADAPGNTPTSGDTLQYKPVYDVTDHVLECELLDENGPVITCEPIPGFSLDSACILHGVLSQNECLRLIEMATTFGMKPITGRIRECARVSAMGEEFANRIFERVQPFLSKLELTPEVPVRGIVFDYESCGTFTPYGLNPCFRICKYNPGGHFFPHYDGGFEILPSDRSFKTFMVYLNDGYAGGHTNFFDDLQPLYENPQVEHMVYSFKPRIGSCLVFNHAIAHDGDALLDNDVVREKWIFRSEVMFSQKQGNAGPNV